jgi:hypothetical protein
MFTSLGISYCKLTNLIHLGICGMDLIPTTICVGANTNGVSVIVIIDLRHCHKI